MTIVNVAPGEPAGDPQHDQNMINRAEGTPPVLLAGKYKTPEDLDKGILELIKRQHGDTNALAAYYKSLESNIGKPQGNDEATPEPTTSEAAPVPNKEQPLSIDPNAAKALADKGLDMTVFEKEFLEKGSLSEESYKTLEAKGYSRALVDQHIEGRKAVADLQAAQNEQFMHEVLASVGGGEAYAKMIQWAAQTMTPDEIVAYNKLVESGDRGVTKMAMENLHTRYTKVNGAPPNLVNADTQMGTPSTGSYQSWEQVKADMRDPRYAKDEAYRQVVHSKLDRSKL
jgi:hypothetical protein